MKACIWFRIAAIPLVAVVFYWSSPWARPAAAIIFLLAAITDWLDGYVARRLQQTSQFGAFLDPVADKLIVSTALILIVQSDPRIVIAALAAIIIGREIAVSALREWMAEVGGRSLINVSWVGKMKTGFQMTAIGFLLYHDNMGWIPIALMGELLLYTAAALTLWSMWTHLRSAWPVISDSRHHVHYSQEDFAAADAAHAARSSHTD
jgi:CDP-diacylglycerol--glycerol-3-phosphate 3-phosphatidyltransferase